LTAFSEDDAWSYEIERFGPRGSYEEAARDIDVTTISAVRAWRLRYGLELRAGAGLMLTDGYSTLDAPPYTHQSADAYGVQTQIGLRYNLDLGDRARLFVDGAHGFSALNTDFPEGGTNWNGLRRWGYGAAFDVTDTWTLEAAYRATHMSNGRGIGPDNPSYNGEGVFLAARRVIE
jgi:opacity protein-like surface antigen